MRQLLVEKYRPSTTEGYVFQDDSVKRKVSKWIKEKEIPNLLLSGIQGTGKTTLSRILVNELGIDKNDVMTINASMLKVEFIRETLEPWLKKASFSPFKIVQLEELDRPLAAVQQALRTVIEDYTDRARFIATCNYDQKIIPALHSRFQSIRMNEINEDGILDLVIGIIENEGIGVDDENTLLGHIDTYSPDIRKIINSIDEHTDENKVLHPMKGGSLSQDLDEWDEIWSTNQVVDKFDRLFQLSELIDLNNFEWFYEVMYTNSKNFPDEAKGIVLLSKYLDRALKAANQRLHLEAFLYHCFILTDEEE